MPDEVGVDARDDPALEGATWSRLRGPLDAAVDVPLVLDTDGWGFLVPQAVVACRDGPDWGTAPSCGKASYEAVSRLSAGFFGSAEDLSDVPASSCLSAVLAAVEVSSASGWWSKLPDGDSEEGGGC